MRFEVKAIVADESGEPQQTRLRRLNERERKLRLARSRRPADEHGARAGQHGRGVHGRSLSRHHMAGSRTVKRAPSTTGAPSTAGRTRFSARMRPPCASILWLEMESPMPEFCPNCRSGRWGGKWSKIVVVDLAR